MKGEGMEGSNDQGQGPRRRDYVVMQQIGLRELIEALGWGEDDNWIERVDAFPHDVLIKVQVVEKTRNAEQAMKEAGHRMLRAKPEEPAIVPAIACPASQWSTAPVHLTPKLDVEVG